MRTAERAQQQPGFHMRRGAGRNTGQKSPTSALPMGDGDSSEPLVPPMAASVGRSTVAAPMPMLHTEKAMIFDAFHAPEVQAPPMLINGVGLFDRLPEESRLRADIIKVAMKLVRLRSVATKTGQWVPQEQIDLAYHVVKEERVADTAAVYRKVEELALKPLDLSRPLWTMHLIPNRSGDSAVLFRLHHGVGDGLSIMRIVGEMATLQDGSPLPEPEGLRKFKEMMAASKRGCFRRICTKLQKVIGVFPALIANLKAPMGRLDTQTKFHAPEAERRSLRFSGKRTMVAFPPFSLAFVKACKIAAGVTINDVVFGAMAGAIRRYCQERGDPLFQTSSTQTLQTRALMPVLMPPSFPPGHDEGDMLTNGITFISVPFAINETTCLGRVKDSSKTMSSLKRSMKVPVSQWLVNASKVLPEAQQQQTVKDLWLRHSMVFSNVQGPDAPIMLSGETIKGFYAYFVNLIPQALISSYAGQMWMNMCVDPDVVQDPDSLIKHFMDELSALGKELNVDLPLC